MTALELLIRRAKSGSYYFVISKQNDMLPFHQETGNIEISSFPDFDGNTLYLRGVDKSRDLREVKIPKVNRNLIMDLLFDYCCVNKKSLLIERKLDCVRVLIVDNLLGLNLTSPELILATSKEQIKLKLQSKLNLILRSDVFTQLANDDNKKEMWGISGKFSCSTCKKINLDLGKMKTTNCCIECNDKLPNCFICSKKSSTCVDHEDSHHGKILVCSDCFKLKNCFNCEKDGLVKLFRSFIYIDHSGREAVNSRSICPKCSSNFIICKNCANVFDNNIYYTCPCKIPKRFKEMIHPYNANVLDFLPPDEGTLELFGIEIEVGVPVNLRHKYKEIHAHTTELINNDGILVYDSSIDYINKAEGIENKFRGFEIVSRPLTYKGMINFIRTISKNRNINLRSWEVGTAGIHIHVNKKLLSNIDIGKILVFTNDKKNRKFIKMIAKREDNKYAKFVPRTMADYNDSSPECHYYAVNTNKPHTIEIRVFRGTLNENTMISYIQYVKSLIDFVKLHSVNHLTHTDYVDWLITKTADFPELVERIRTESLDVINDKDQI